MHDKKTDFRAVARTSNLNEELGQVEYVFSDKTGTLTSNVMELQKISIRSNSYAIEDKTRKIFEAMREEGDPVFPYVKQFLIHLATCHTVMPEKNENGSVTYQAASPDERALVIASEKLGSAFHTRKPKRVLINLVRNSERFIVICCRFLLETFKLIKQSIFGNVISIIKIMF